jgi:hypothetical protein
MELKAVISICFFARYGFKTRFKCNQSNGCGENANLFLHTTLHYLEYNQIPHFVDYFCWRGIDVIVDVIKIC